MPPCFHLATLTYLKDLKIHPISACAHFSFFNQPFSQKTLLASHVHLSKDIQDISCPSSQGHSIEKFVSDTFNMAHNAHQVLPTPPSSHKPPRSSYRELNSSEESSPSTGSVIIDTSDKYRIGIPAPLRSLPLACQHADRESPHQGAFEDIEVSIVLALDKTGLRTYSLQMLQRYVAGEIPTDDDYTIVIHAEQQDHWVDFINVTLEILQAKKLPRFRIEVCDQRARLTFYPVKIQPHVANTWQFLELKIISILGGGPQWKTVAMLNRGHTKEDSVPTVTIGLTNKASVTWQKAKYEQLVDLVSHMGFDFAFIRSQFRDTGFSAPPDALYTSEFEGPMALGSSLGTNERIGTLGGYHQVQYQGQTYLMGITSHHVVQVESMTKV